MNCPKCLLQRHTRLLFFKYRLFSAAFSESKNKSRPAKERRENSEDERVVQKSLRLAVVGCPNAGKSALTNRLIKANVCAVSRLVDTTRENTTTSITEKDVQLEIVDSPGIIGLSHAKRLIGTDSDSKILADPEKAIKRAEHVLDVTSSGKYLHHRLIHLLYRYTHIPASLVLNKIDLLPNQGDLFELAEILTEGVIDGQPIPKKQAKFGKMGPIQSNTKNEEVLTIHPNVNSDKHDEQWHKTFGYLRASLIQMFLRRMLQIPTHKCSWSDTKKLFGNQCGWPHFKAVYFLSSLNGNGIDTLRESLLTTSELNDRNWRFEKTADPRRICIEQIRSELMNRLPSNVAYALWPQTHHWDIEEDPNGFNGERMINLGVNIHCDKKQWARLVYKIVDAMESKLRNDFQNLFSMPVRLKISVKFGGKLYPHQIPEELEKFV